MLKLMNLLACSLPNLFRSIFIIHTAVLLGAGCATREGQDAGKSAFRVALLTPGPITDQAWNSSAYMGLERIRDSLAADVSHIQTKTPAEIGRAHV